MTDPLTFVLIHGGGSSAWDWHLVTPELERAGHPTVAVDLPIEDPAATLDDYAAAVTAAVPDGVRTIVVGHSLGGFTAPIAASRLDAEGLVYLSAMIPRPGETPEQWWVNTGHDRETIDDEPFFTGVPAALVAEAGEHERTQQAPWWGEPWPLDQHPDIPHLGIVCLDDKFFSAPFMRRQVLDRLGCEPIEIIGGHYAPIGNPTGVAEALLAFARTVEPPAPGGPMA